MTQFVGLPCTILLGKISEKWEARKVLIHIMGLFRDRGVRLWNE